MDTTGLRPTDLQRLAETLWEERHVVEHLLFRLTCAKLLLAADEQRFVPNAIDEVEQTVDRLRQVELLREGVVDEVSRAVGLSAGGLSLGDLAEHTPSPWNEVFADHRRAFLALAEEIENTTAANRTLASQALGRVRTAIDKLSGSAPASSTYDRAGHASGTVTAPLHLDRAL